MITNVIAKLLGGLQSAAALLNENQLRALTNTAKAMIAGKDPVATLKRELFKLGVKETFNR